MIGNSKAEGSRQERLAVAPWFLGGPTVFRSEAALSASKQEVQHG
jgi:hypothetical protein